MKASLKSVRKRVMAERRGRQRFGEEERIRRKELGMKWCAEKRGIGAKV